MTTHGTTHSHASPMSRALDGLRAVLGERLVLAGAPGFDEAAAVTFTGEPRTPAAVARPGSTAEVAAAVRAARDAGLPVAVRSGGHSYARLSTAPGALVIDTRLLADVSVDPAGRVASAGGGVSAIAYTQATAEHGLATGFGDTGGVGVSGLTLGGGVGHLGRRDGLTIDNLVGAEVVLADGSVVRAAQDENPDLFWALRGGGGGLGVVTRLDLRLHPTTTVTGGMLILPATPAALAGALEAVLAAPDEVSAIINVMKAPPLPAIPPELHGTPIVLVLPCWSGEPDQAEAGLAPLRALGPVVDGLAQMPYPALFAGGPDFGSTVPVVGTGFRDTVDEEWAATVIECVLSAPGFAAVNLRPLGGAIARVPADATAFAHRDRRVMVTAAMPVPEAAVAASPEAVPAARAWLAATEQAIGLGDAGYVNFMASLASSDLARAYPPATLDRLRGVRAAYDPDGFFAVR